MKYIELTEKNKSKYNKYFFTFYKILYQDINLFNFDKKIDILFL